MSTNDAANDRPRDPGDSKDNKICDHVCRIIISAGNFCFEFVTVIVPHHRPFRFGTDPRLRYGISFQK